jgi:hypothetical protein
MNNENNENIRQNENLQNDNSEVSESVELQVRQTEEIVKHQSEPAILPEQENPIDTTKVQSGEVLGKYESDDEYQKVIDIVNKDINEANKIIESGNDWKEYRLRLNDIKDRLKALFLKKEDNDSIINSINDLFQMIAERQNEEKEKFDEESEKNYSHLKGLVENAIKTAEEAEDFKTARTGLINVQESFRGVKLRRKHRDELLEDMNKAFEALQKRQAIERENFEMETIENYHSLKNLVQEAIEFSEKSLQFGKARQRLIKAQSQIKGKKLKRDQRDELYQYIRNAFNNLNEKQEADRELFEKETNLNYENLKKIVEQAISFAKDSTDYKEARESLINAQGTIKGMKLKRKQRDQLYADIREVFNSINESQEEDRKEFDEQANDNYKRLTEKVDDAFDLVHGVSDFRLIRETLISIQSEVKIVKLRRAQRNELFARIREAFNVFDKKKDEYFQERKSEKKSKLEAIIENLTEKNNRLTKEIASAKEELENETKKNESEEIDEEQKALINKKIQSLTDKINEKEKTLEQDNKRIEDVKNEIEQLDKEEKK